MSLKSSVRRRAREVAKKMPCIIRARTAEGHQRLESYESETARRNALEVRLGSERAAGHTVSNGEPDVYVVTSQSGAFICRYEFCANG